MSVGLLQSDDSDGSDREDSSTSGQLSADTIPSIKSGFCVKQGAVVSHLSVISENTTKFLQVRFV